jgi:hypothetical protein
VSGSEQQAQGASVAFLARMRVLEGPSRKKPTAVYRAVVNLPPGKETVTLQAVALDEIDLMSSPAKVTIARQ